MDYGFFINNVPFVLVFMSLYLLFELIRINKIVNMWEVESLMFIPTFYCILYLWIGIFQPDPALTKSIGRTIVALSLGISIRVAHSYYKNFVKRGQN